MLTGSFEHTIGAGTPAPYHLVLRPGDHFGQRVLFGDHLRTGQVVAIEDSSVLFIERGQWSAATAYALASVVLSVGGFFAALVAALWAYDGWDNVGLVGSEIQNPSRNIPLALVAGVSLVAVLYILTSGACFHVLPFAQAAASPHVVSDVIASVAGSHVASWLTVAMIICALGTLNSSILTGARVDYAMARDGRFFRVARGIHPRFRTPANALIFQGCLAAVLALTGTFQDLFSLYIFAQWIFYGLATAAVLRLRRTEPELARPYRTWGYPVVPVIFILGSIAVTASVLIARPLRAGLGLVVILIGLFFYRHWRAQQATNPGA